MSNAAKKAIPESASKIVARYFTDAVIEVLKVQCSYSVTAGRQFVCVPAQGVSPGASDIAAVIGLVGSHFNGSVAMCYGKKPFLALTGQALGAKYDEITSDITDAAGEFLNMIFGVAKLKLSEEAGFRFDSAFPSIVTGSNVQIRPWASKSEIGVPFQCVDGELEMRVSFDSE